MPSLTEFIQEGRRTAEHRPWPRAAVDADTWRTATATLARGDWSLLDLWGEPEQVHMTLLDQPGAAIGTISLACPDRRYPSVARHHPPALRLERAARDLYGLEADGLPDTRPWLDHGRWGVQRPLADAERPAAPLPPYGFLPVEGEGLHQTPVGPVHAGVIEPGHFRFTTNGETVVRLEERFGYVHKGIDGLIAGSEIDQAARLAGRTSGDSTVAYGLAFALAVEAAVGMQVPPRARLLRALMAELERLANHFGDIGAVCNDAAFAIMHAHCGILRERVLRTADAAFGHRLMRDRVIPGGVAVDLEADGATAVRTLLAEAHHSFPPLVAMYDETASLQDRTVSTGILSEQLARQYAAGGFVGRASGRSFDARSLPGYAPYDGLDFEVPVRHDGDVNARVWIRIQEVGQSLTLVERVLEQLVAGADSGSPLLATLPGRAGEGAALVEGFRGDIHAWVRIGADGIVERCRLRDPSWFQWPLLEAAIEGNIVADFPICNKSFNCSYSGHDL